MSEYPCTLDHLACEVVKGREIGNLLPNNQRQRRTCYALCHILYPVSVKGTWLTDALRPRVLKYRGNSPIRKRPPPYDPPKTLGIGLR